MMDITLFEKYFEGQMTKWQGWKELKINKNWIILYYDGAYILRCKHGKSAGGCCKVPKAVAKKLAILRQMHRI